MIGNRYYEGNYAILENFNNFKIIIEENKPVVFNDKTVPYAKPGYYVFMQDVTSINWKTCTQKGINNIIKTLLYAMGEYEYVALYLNKGNLHIGICTHIKKLARAVKNSKHNLIISSQSNNIIYIEDTQDLIDVKREMEEIENKTEVLLGEINKLNKRYSKLTKQLTKMEQ